MTETLIQKLINRPSITVYVNSSIQDLVQILNKNRVGCAVVIDIKSAFPVGIVSERDLIRNHDKIINNNNIKVSDVMTKKIISCKKNVASKELMEIMSNNKIRHIPIIEENKLLGVVSIGDVVNRIIENYAYETKYLREYINN
tara:strand:- start:331 stop:759 length:429 start_codon:yes stop_codon:yes gene_type:complete